MSLAKVRLKAAKALRDGEGGFIYPDPERHPYIVSIARGVVAMVPAESVPDWGKRFAADRPNLAEDDGLAIDRAMLRDALDYEAFGEWVDDPIAGGHSGLAWAVTVTALGNLVVARIPSVLHLAAKWGLERDGVLHLPRRGLFRPYAPPDRGLDLRKFPEVLTTLTSLPLKKPDA